MAEEPPKRLDEYCKTSGISFFDLSLPCAFCNFPLTLQEHADFFCKQLCLLYRNGEPYAACVRCLKVSARHEFEQYCRCSLPATILGDVLNQPITNVCIRCVVCYKSLDAPEKIDLCSASESVYLVRHLWRGICRDCRKK